MSIMFSTQHAAVDSRVEYWNHVIDSTLLPLRGRHRSGDFQARLVAGQIGAVRVAEATTPAGECLRTRKLIGRSDTGVYQVDVMVQGHAVVEQDDRQAALAAGDIAFVDPVRPVRYLASASTHVAVLFPRSMLPLRADDVARLTAVRIPGDQGTGALVSTLARQLPRHLDDCHSAEAARLGVAVVDLLGVALAARLDREPPADCRQPALLRQIYAFVDTHLADPALDPASIAGAHNISLRALHKLFEGERTTVADWIRQRRLDRCRRDLLDPRQRNRPVAAVAARWGLPNAAHFNRIFKATYGMPPARYRSTR